MGEYRIPTTQNDDQYAFISYSHNDYLHVEPILTALHEHGYRFWYDIDLKAGRKWRPELEQRIRNSSAFVCFVSKASMSSSSFVLQEINYAIDQQHPNMLMVMLEDTPFSPKLNANVHEFQYFRFYDNEYGDLQILLDYLDENGVAKDQPVNETAYNNCKNQYLQNLRMMEIGTINPELFAPIVRAENKQPIDDFVNEIIQRDPSKLSRHIFVEAAGGYGKTHRFFDAMRQLLSLNRMCAYIQCIQIDDENFIQDHLRQNYLPAIANDMGKIKQWFAAYHSKPFVLFLDGYNENTNQSKLQNAISKLIDIPGLQLIVSSRYKREFFYSFHALTLQELSQQDVSRMLNQANRNYASMSRGMRKVLQTPMFLSLYLSAEEGQYQTASALMQQEIEALLHRYAIKRGGTDSASYQQFSRILNDIFPLFVCNDYRNYHCRLTFTKVAFEDFVRAFPQECDGLTAERILSELVQHKIILYAPERRSYFYRHEHWRDYWVAHYLHNQILRILDSDKGGNEQLHALLCHQYSDVIFEHLGAMLEEQQQLGEVLNMVRLPFEATDEEYEQWQSDENATTTERLLCIYKQLHKEDGISYLASNCSLRQLNLKRTDLSQVTIPNDSYNLFDGSLISADTFAPTTHESAVRRVEIIKSSAQHVEDAEDGATQTLAWSVSFGNSDILICSCPDLKSPERYEYPNKGLNLIDSTETIRQTVLGVNRNNECWYWSFAEDIPTKTLRIEQCLPVEGVKAVTVTKYKTAKASYYALLSIDGRIILIEPRKSTFSQLSKEFHTGIADARVTKNTFTSEANVNNGYLFWAEPIINDGTQTALRIMRYRPQLGSRSECIATLLTDFEPDRMTYNPEKDILVLSTVAINRTQLWQIRQATKKQATATLLTWPNGLDQLTCRLEQAERGLLNRINAIEYCGAKMALSNNVGMLYIFSFDAKNNCYQPDDEGHTLQITSPLFAANDVKFIDSNTLIVASIKRLLLTVTLNPLEKLHIMAGHNHGLRKLHRLSEDHYLALAYDGCILDLYKSSQRFRCAKKVYIGDWAWSLAVIDSHRIIVGCLERLQLFDIDTFKRLGEPHALSGRAEAIVYLDGYIYCATDSGISIFEVDSNDVLQEKGRMPDPIEGKRIYALLAHDHSLLVSYSQADNTNPQLLLLHNEQQQWLPVAPPHSLGAYDTCQDIKVCDNLLFAVGMLHEAENKASCFGRLCSYDHSRFTTLADTDEFPNFASRCNIHKESDGRYRIVVLTNAYKIYEYLWDGNRLTLQHDLAFPAWPCDALFNSNGDILVCCLNGVIYKIDKMWQQTTELFKNVFGMMICNCNFSGVKKTLSAERNLADTLIDFSNVWDEDEW